MHGGTINIFAPNWAPQDSYGRISRELSEGLRRRHWHVNAFGDGAPRGIIKTVVGGLVLGYPTLLSNCGALASMGPRVAMTMFESTKLPFGWADTLNQMNAVIVPSKFQVEVFRDSGVDVPIHVLPLGVSSAFKYQERPTGRPYTFLAIADRGRRKGWDKAVSAFSHAFGDRMDVRLVLKCRKGALPFTAIQNPNIDLTQADLTDRQMAALYGTADCMIFPAAGEGFGLPPREFAATGGISIATDWGGTADDLPEWGLPIKSTPEPAWNGHPRFGGMGLGDWAAVDTDHLMRQMLHVVENADFYRARGKSLSAFVRKHYRWTAFAAGVERIWQEVCHAHAESRRAVS